MFYNKFVAETGAAGAVALLLYGSGSVKIMQVRLRNIDLFVNA
jgi:hypothetical protein